MDSTSKPIASFRGSIDAAVNRQDVGGLIAEAEALMAWQQSNNDDEKVEAAALLDDIAGHLMRSQEYAAARMVIIGSLKVKGTLGKESGLTTFSYQQLAECDKAADLQESHAVDRRAHRPTPTLSNAWMLLIALLAVASVWGVFVLMVH